VSSCRTEISIGQLHELSCAEWEGPKASELTSYCGADGTTFAHARCDRQGSVGECVYDVEDGLTIRIVYFESAESAASSCASQEGEWHAP
jgi:hypothetical protein